MSVIRLVRVALESQLYSASIGNCPGTALGVPGSSLDSPGAKRPLGSPGELPWELLYSVVWRSCIYDLFWFILYAYLKLCFSAQGPFFTFFTFLTLKIFICQFL